MSLERSRPWLASLVLLAAAAAAWLLLRGGDAGETGGNEPGRGDTPQASATLPAASLAADGPGLAPPAGNGPARTEVASAPAEQAGYELSGRLVTSGHAPLSGVEIALSALDRAAAAGLPAASLREPPAPALTGRSDADGRFRLRVRGGQESALRVRDDAWHLRGDGTDVGLDMLRVTALSADRDLGDIVLGRNARVAGRVQNEAGKTIAGVRVAVSGGRTGLLLGGIGDLVTGAEGEFASAGLKPGRYTITTASPDYLPAEVKVELQEGEHRDDLVIEVRSGHTIAGLVVDDLGTPLPGMKVTADRARELTPGVQVRSSSSGEAATTDAGGRFVLHGLETATVNVDAWGPGHARGTLANVAAGTTDLVVRL